MPTSASRGRGLLINIDGSTPASVSASTAISPATTGSSVATAAAVHSVAATTGPAVATAVAACVSPASEEPGLGLLLVLAHF